MTDPALSARLRAIFLDELDEQTRAAGEHLLKLEEDPGDSSELRSLFRVMHTLKGAARSAGVPEIEKACHDLESILMSARDAERGLSRDELDQLLEGVRGLTAARRSLVLVQEASSAAGEIVLAADEIGPVAPPTAGPQGAEPASAEIPGEQAGPAVRDTVIRIGQERVDELYESANQLLIFADQVAELPATMRLMHERAAGAASASARIRRKLAAPEFQRVQSSLGMAPARNGSVETSDLDDTVQWLTKEADQLLTTVNRLAQDGARIANGMARGVRQLRLRPFGDALADMQRVIRDLAATTGKRVRLETSGDTVQADRAVLFHLHEAMMHLVRNSIDHGIESPDVRRAAGKPEEGTIRIRAEIVGDRIMVIVSDDGAGLDIPALRKQLEARGESIPGDDQVIANRLLFGGISAKPAAGAISGRGVGLDAVRAAAERIRGTVSVAWTQGRGSEFIIESPLTLATVRALLVQVGQVRIAVPAAFVERLASISSDDLHVIEGRPVLGTPDGQAIVASLAAVLGPPLVARRRAGKLLLVVVRLGDGRIALEVDEFIDEVEVVVQPVRARGQRAIPHLSGSAMLANGAIALVLNVPAAIATARRLAPVPVSEAKATSTGMRHRVLVVDDSITTRTLEASVLEAAGYDVVTATDGADAWRSLQERGADLVVSDVEMPRMDGFELCNAIRGSARFRELPVILVTALESAEHRARGLEVGADAYLGKSSFDQEALLITIREMLD